MHSTIAKVAMSEIEALSNVRMNVKEVINLNYSKSKIQEIVVKKDNEFNFNSSSKHSRSLIPM